VRVSRTGRKSLPMRKYTIMLLLAIPLIAAACGTAATAGGTAPGGPGTGAATVTMNATNFVPNNHAVTIKSGQAVTFVDPMTTGGFHILVVGTNGTYKATAGAPAALNVATGLQINAGDTKAITFPTAGTYQITCTIHPYMQVTITVSA
jgi:plastocyanin